MVVLSAAVVLENSVGGNAVMAAQLEHLLEITQRTSVSVRVLPWSVGAHGGMGAANSFNLLEFPAEPRTEEPLEPPLVYVNTLTGVMYLNKPDEVSAYQLVWDDLERQALSEAESRKMITRGDGEISRCLT